MKARYGSRLVGDNAFQELIVSLEILNYTLLQFKSTRALRAMKR